MKLGKTNQQKEKNQRESTRIKDPLRTLIISAASFTVFPDPWGEGFVYNSRTLKWDGRWRQPHPLETHEPELFSRIQNNKRHWLKNKVEGKGHYPNLFSDLHMYMLTHKYTPIYTLYTHIHKIINMWSKNINLNDFSFSFNINLKCLMSRDFSQFWKLK